jgi:glycerol-3-phosphate acyltransferase PlsY
VFFGCAGGRGVATALGVLLGWEPLLGLASAATWVIVALFFRYSSLAALLSAVFAPVYYIFGDGVAWVMDSRILLALSVMTVLLIYRHADNIDRLLCGKETRIGKKRNT